MIRRDLEFAAASAFVGLCWCGALCVHRYTREMLGAILPTWVSIPVIVLLTTALLMGFRPLFEARRALAVFGALGVAQASAYSYAAFCLTIVALRSGREMSIFDHVLEVLLLSCMSSLFLAGIWFIALPTAALSGLFLHRVAKSYPARA